MRHVKFLGFLLILLLLSACASSRSGQVYTRDQARTSHSVQYGTVVQVTPVQIEGTQTGAGALGGAALGGIAGSTIGGGRGSALTAVAGGIAGALGGAALEKGVTNKDGLEITVRLDTGEMLAVVQEADEVYRIGDRVRVLKDNQGTTRVRY